MKSIVQSAVKTPVTIKSVNLSQSKKEKLKALGIHEGRTVIVKSFLPAKGLVLIKNGSGEIAIAHNIASMIEVE